MNTKTLAVASVLSIATAGQAQTVVGSFQLVDQGGFGGLFDTMNVSLGMVKDLFPFEPTNLIFFEEDLEIGLSDVGTTWTSDTASMSLIRTELQDADSNDSFGVRVGLELPDGDEFVYFQTVLESEFPAFGLDLATIASETDEIRVTLLSFSTESPGRDLNGDGVWTDYAARYQFDFVSIPTPGVGAVLLCAGGGVLVRRARR